MKYISTILVCVIFLSGCSTKKSISDVTKNNTPYDLLTNALLEDRLKIDVIKEEGGSNPCEPQEPYYRLSVKKHGLERYDNAEMGEEIKTRETLESSDIADGIVLIESTGKIEIMDMCLE